MKKKIALGLTVSAVAIASAFAMAPASHAKGGTKVGCYIDSPGQVLSVSVGINAPANNSDAPSPVMPWNCLA